MLLRAEAHIVAVVRFVVGGDRKMEMIVEGTPGAQAEAVRIESAAVERCNFGLPHMALEEGQRQPYAPSAWLR